MGTGYEVTESAVYIRHQELKKYQLQSRNPQMNSTAMRDRIIPGRLNSKQIEEVLVKYRDSDDKHKVVHEISTQYQLEASVIENLVKWNRFPTLLIDKDGDKYAE